ncbi:MAG: hypothetical protein MZV63_18015 [Marinilabiliales bacterium]|nr:hypothetical protein [Marinilabiliales bacterium]
MRRIHRHQRHDAPARPAPPPARPRATGVDRGSRPPPRRPRRAEAEREHRPRHESRHRARSRPRCRRTAPPRPCDPRAQLREARQHERDGEAAHQVGQDRRGPENAATAAGSAKIPAPTERLTALAPSDHGPMARVRRSSAFIHGRRARWLASSRRRGPAASSSSPRCRPRSASRRP